MHYMYLVSCVQNSGPPPQKLMEELHKLATRERQAGRMITDGGLMPLDMGARIELRLGKIKVMDGPFTETKEVIGGFAIFEYATREAAVQSAVEFMELHRLYAAGWEGVCEMREMMSPPLVDRNSA
jgi:hypothetical protein